jgi:hypothetical protein
MSDFEAKREFSHSPHLQPISPRSAARSAGCRKGVEKEQRELLALQIANRVPTPYLARQIALMGGRA